MKNGHTIQEGSFGGCGLKSTPEEGLLWLRARTNYFRKNRNLRGNALSDFKTFEKGGFFENIFEGITRRSFEKILQIN